MQNALLKVEMVDTADLAVHPLAKKLPGWELQDERYKALKRDIQERGIQSPLRIDGENKILDGREVWKAAKELQIRTVPCVRTDDDPATVIVMGLALRKHYSKGALAYVTYPLMQKAWEASISRRLKNIKNTNDSRSSTEWTFDAKRVEQLADMLGFGRTLFFQAKQLHELFAKSDEAVRKWVESGSGQKQPEDFRARFELELLEGDKGLGAIIAGIGGLDATKGKPREDYGQLELFSEAWETLEKRFTYWNKFDEPTKNALAPKIRRIVKDMPADLREQFAKALKEAQKADN